MNSKKIFISFLFVGILAMQSTFCQITKNLIAPTCAYSSREAIGRVSSDGNHIISYHDHGSYREFFWTDLSTNNCRKFNLENNIHVNDFERIGDTIFFCGYENQGSIVGYFTESEFTATPNGVFYALIPEAQSLEKMEVYSDPNTQNHVVAAIGYENTGFNANNTSVFIIEFIGSNINYSYFFTNGTMYGKKFEDVAVTPKFIVTVGVMSASANQIAITVIDKNNTTSLNPYFPIETAGNITSNNYSIEYLEKEEVAISTLVSDLSSSPFYSPVHVFDASSGTFINSQRIPLLQKSAPYNEMKYFPDYKMLVLLQTNYYPDQSAENSVFYYLFPYNTISYNALITYDTKSYYYSLDRFSKKEYLATGELKTLSHSFLTHDILSTPSFNCLNDYNQKIEIINTPSASTTPISMLYPFFVTLKSFIPQIATDYVATQCNQKR